MSGDATQPNLSEQARRLILKALDHEVGRLSDYAQDYIAAHNPEVAVAIQTKATQLASARNELAALLANLP